MDEPMGEKDFQLLLKISEDITRNQSKLENIDNSLLTLNSKLIELERKVDAHEDYISQQKGFKSGSISLLGVIGTILGILGGALGMYLSLK